MTGKTITVRLRSKRDTDLIKLFDRIDEGERSEFIRRCVRSVLQSMANKKGPQRA